MASVNVIIAVVPYYLFFKRQIILTEAFLIEQWTARGNEQDITNTLLSN